MQLLKTLSQFLSSKGVPYRLDYVGQHLAIFIGDVSIVEAELWRIETPTVTITTGLSNVDGAAREFLHRAGTEPKDCTAKVPTFAQKIKRPDVWWMVSYGVDTRHLFEFVLDSRGLGSFRTLKEARAAYNAHDLQSPHRAKQLTRVTPDSLEVIEEVIA